MTDTNTTPTNTPEQHTVLIDSIGKYLVGMIEGIVERKVQQIFDSHATMALINEKTEERLQEIAKDLMDEHETDYEHNSTDDIHDTVATYVNDYDHTNNIKQAVYEVISDGDYATEERVQEMIDEHDYEESVKEVLRNI